MKTSIPPRAWGSRLEASARPRPAPGLGSTSGEAPAAPQLGHCRRLWEPSGGHRRCLGKRSRPPRSHRLSCCISGTAPATPNAPGNRAGPKCQSGSCHLPERETSAAAMSVGCTLPEAAPAFSPPLHQRKQQHGGETSQGWSLPVRQGPIHLLSMKPLWVALHPTSSPAAPTQSLQDSSSAPHSPHTQPDPTGNLPTPEHLTSLLPHSFQRALQVLP